MLLFLLDCQMQTSVQTEARWRDDACKLDNCMEWAAFTSICVYTRVRRQLLEGRRAAIPWTFVITKQAEIDLAKQRSILRSLERQLDFCCRVKSCLSLAMKIIWHCAQGGRENDVLNCACSLSLSLSSTTMATGGRWISFYLTMLICYWSRQDASAIGV